MPSVISAVLAYLTFWFQSHHTMQPNPYCERVISSIRRDVLHHMGVLNERHLRRAPQSYVDYDHTWRVHQSLDMDAPDSRPVRPPQS